MESFSSPQPVKALARIYDNYTHVIVRSASGINSVADMKGKRISVGSAKSGTEVIALRMLKATFADVKHVKPKASRAESSELYLVATGFIGRG